MRSILALISVGRIFNGLREISSILDWDGFWLWLVAWPWMKFPGTTAIWQKCSFHFNVWSSVVRFGMHILPATLLQRSGEGHISEGLVDVMQGSPIQNSSANMPLEVKSPGRCNSIYSTEQHELGHIKDVVDGDYVVLNYFPVSYIQK